MLRSNIASYTWGALCMNAYTSMRCRHTCIFSTCVLSNMYISMHMSMHMCTLIHALRVCCIDCIVTQYESVFIPFLSFLTAVSLPCCRPLKASSAKIFVSAQSTHFPSRCIIRALGIGWISRLLDFGKGLLQLQGDRFERGGH